MPVEDLLADRYNKFRKIGLYEEYKVPGGQWREVKAARDKARLSIETLFMPVMLSVLKVGRGSEKERWLQIAHGMPQRTPS